jgi:hypothetical protein
MAGKANESDSGSDSGSSSDDEPKKVSCHRFSSTCVVLAFEKIVAPIMLQEFVPNSGTCSLAALLSIEQQAP